MAKALKDILQQAHDRIKGVHASTTSAGSTGKEAGVDYKPKAGAEQDFIAKHSVEKWDEPHGNPNYADKVKEAPYKKQTEGVYESKKAEDTKCNHTPGQTWCPIHEMADCSMSKTIKEKYDDNSTKVSDWSDKKLKWHASDDRKHSSSHVPAWSELKRRAKTSAPKKTNEEVDQIDEVSSALLYRAKQAAQKKAGWLMPGDGGKGDKAWNRVKKFRDAGVAKEKQEKAAVKEEAIDEISKDLAKSYIRKATQDVDNTPEDNDNATRKLNNRESGIRTASMKKNASKYVKVPATEEVVSEVLTKSTTAGETISDFVHSKNPQFAGKSKEKRKQMALAAYYAKQRNEETDPGFAEGTVPHDYHQSRLPNYGLNKSDAGTMSKVASMMAKEKAAQAAKKKQTVKEWNAVEPLLGGDQPQPPRGGSDEAVEMVKSELKALANKAMHLVTQMPDNMHVEPWVQAKIATAKELVSSVHDYMIYADHKDEEDEQMDTPMTFPNMSADVNTGRNV